MDMAYFVSKGEMPREVVRQTVQRADLLIAIIGFRYGAVVPDDTTHSYVELELQAAAEAGIPSLVFMLSENTSGPVQLFFDKEHGARQVAFRTRLKDTGGYVVGVIDSSDSLETSILQALAELQYHVERQQRRPRSSSPITPSTPSNDRTTDRIFISHATADRLLVDHLIDFMVLAGVPEESLYYSAQRSTGTPTGLAFVEHVKRQLVDASLVIQVITETYLMQPFCLAELGAQWALDSRSFPIAVPPVTSAQVSGVLAGVQVSVLDEETVQELYGVLTGEVGLDLNAGLWNRAYRRILQDVPQLVAQLPPTPMVPRSVYDETRSRLESVTAEFTLLKARMPQESSE